MHVQMRWRRGWSLKPVNGQPMTTCPSWRCCSQTWCVPGRAGCPSVGWHQGCMHRSRQFPPHSRFAQLGRQVYLSAQHLHRCPDYIAICPGKPSKTPTLAISCGSVHVWHMHASKASVPGALGQPVLSLSRSPSLPCLHALLSSGRARVRAGDCDGARGTARGCCSARRRREASRMCRGCCRTRRGAALQGLQQVHAAGGAHGAGLCRTCAAQPCLSIGSSF